MREASDFLFAEKRGRLPRIREVIQVMYGRALEDIDRKIESLELKPKHGPGATADKLIGNQKWKLPTWHDRLETVFPYTGYGVPTPRDAWLVEGIKYLEPQDEPPVRLTDVPKTRTKPRLIAIEPTCMQYMQQAVGRELMHSLEVDPLAKWFVGFTEQWPNQAMAQCGSDDQSVATIDLSEASDRLANWLVEDLFERFPSFLEGIQACRSTRVVLPSGGVLTLQKFASMGSALTFPIETMLFAAIAIERVLSVAKLPISRTSIERFRGTVRAYGDDIIVPTGMAEDVIGGLEALGFKVNRNKSFWTGEFRESCGKEYWAGYDVSIVKFRSELPASHRDATSCVSTVSTRNQLFAAGLTSTAHLLDGHMEKVLLGHYPEVTETSDVLGRVNGTGRYDVTTYSNDTLNRPRVKGWKVRVKIPKNEISGHNALLKGYVSPIALPSAIDEHLKYSGRPLDVSINLGNGSPF